MLRFGAMGKRIFVIVCALTLLGMLIFGGMTLFTLEQNARSNGKSQLEMMLLQLKLGIEQDYQSLLQLSQHMATTGPVGQIVSDYQRAQDSYERGAVKRALTKALSTYGGLGTQLVMYYDEDTREAVLSIFLPDQDFQRGDDDETLFANAFVRYHAIHPSHYEYSSRMVVSLARPAGFDDGARYGIYIERLSGVPQVIAEASQAQGVAFAMLQLDEQGMVRYSSDQALFPLGKVPALSESNFGDYGEYYYAKTGFAFGASCVVLAPMAAYNVAIASWARRAGVAAVLVAMLMLLASWLLYRTVFRGLSVFKREIDVTLSGDLDSAAQLTNIKELDQLLRHFDRMKRNIQRIMREDAARTTAMHRREREMLIYQINPHFLLNTLNALHWRAAMDDQRDIAQFVSHLSAILSYNLGRGTQPPTLRTELNMLDAYLAIEQARHDFHVEHDIEAGEYLDMKTPRLILQPIVENAIGHGMDDGGHLLIRVSLRENGFVAVEIADDGCGIDEAVIAELMSDWERLGGGVGLRYVRAALDDYYQGMARLTIENRPEGGTRVLLTLPMDREGSA